MGVYVKDWKIPIECGDCPFADIAICDYGCPLVEVPTPHGRLIDADELKKHKYHDKESCENAVAVAEIDWSPVIIESED